MMYGLRLFTGFVYLCLLIFEPGTACFAASEADDDLFSLDLETLMTLHINPSADASARGLSQALAGNQLGEAVNLGILGSQPISQIPFSITSYTQSSIRDGQAPSIGEVLQYDPTVRVARGFGTFQQLYRIRGFHAYSDDMLYNGLYGLLPRQYLASQLVERVEITRGVSAFLNGATSNNSSLGGVINIMPKRATLKPITHVSMGYEADQQWLVSTDLARRSGNKRFGIRLNAASRDGDSSVSPEKRELGLLSLGFDFAGERLRASSDIGYQQFRLEQTQPSVDFASELGILSPPSSDKSISQPWNYARERDWFGSLHVQYDISANITLWLAGGLREGKEDAIYLSSLLVNNSAGDLTASRFDVKHEDSVITGASGLSIRWHSGSLEHTSTLAVNNFKNESRNAYAIYSGVTDNLYDHQAVALPTTLDFAAGELSDPGVTQTIRRMSYALVDQILWNERWQLLLGVRVQQFHDDAFDYDTHAKQASYRQHLSTPLLAAMFHYNKQLASYVNYSETSLAAGFAPAGADNAGVEIDPLRNKQLELGMKWHVQHGGSTLSLYRIEAPILGFDASNHYGDIDDDEVHQGIEWLFYGEWLSGIRSNGGFSLMRTDIDGNSTIGVPRKQGNLNIAWDLDAVPEMTLNSYLIYTGDHYADRQNHKRIPSWWRWDLGLRYQLSGNGAATATLRIKIENITNRDYWASTGGYPGAAYLTVGQPRTLLLSLGLDF